MSHDDGKHKYLAITCNFGRNFNILGLPSIIGTPRFPSGNGHLRLSFHVHHLGLTASRFHLGMSRQIDVQMHNISEDLFHGRVK
jgi:hypothetical protein